MQTAQLWLHQDSITTYMSNSFAKMVSVEPTKYATKYNHHSYVASVVEWSGEGGCDFIR